MSSILPSFRALYSSIMAFLTSLRLKFFVVSNEDYMASSKVAEPARASRSEEGQSTGAAQEAELSFLRVGTATSGHSNVLPLLETTLGLFEEQEIAYYLRSSFSEAFGDSRLDLVLGDIASLPTESFIADRPSDAPWSPEDSPLPLTPILPPIPPPITDVNIERKPFGLGIDVFHESSSIEITTCPSFLFASDSGDDFFSTSYLSNDSTLLDTPESISADIKSALDMPASSIDAEINILHMPETPTQPRIECKAPFVQIEKLETEEEALRDLIMPGGFCEEVFSAGEDEPKDGLGGGLSWRSAFSRIHAYVSYSRRVDTEARWPDLERGI
ncbi:hypothetical protein HGRIS_004689 [Hohenbuehelia grisea]|uniref:Uncharacterized protein n=1 Tax=Hohenbuehelia grisea TaxID=104357 RepID=A0ABR3JDW8_9AGAR